MSVDSLCAWCPWRTEEGFRFPGIRVKDSCELPGEYWVLNPGKANALYFRTISLARLSVLWVLDSISLLLRLVESCEYFLKYSGKLVTSNVKWVSQRNSINFVCIYRAADWSQCLNMQDQLSLALTSQASVVNSLRLLYKTLLVAVFLNCIFSGPFKPSFLLEFVSSFIFICLFFLSLICCILRYPLW